MTRQAHCYRCNRSNDKRTPPPQVLSVSTVQQMATVKCPACGRIWFASSGFDTLPGYTEALRNAIPGKRSEYH